ncbi:GH92 family glycosyl hydrolase [Kribbella sandramycini]
MPETACGKTYPGPVTPFGLVQLSPDTVSGGDHGSGYSADMETIEGFSFTHLGGVGCYGDLGNLQVMPQTGALVTGRVAANSRYREQTVSAGYYSVELERYDVRVELAAAARAGMLRFTFAADRPRVKVDLARRIGFDGSHSVEQSFTVVDDHRVEGWMRCDRSGGGWICGQGPAFTVHFALVFDRAIVAHGNWEGAEVRADRSRTTTAAEAGCYAEFDGPGVLRAKAGISYTSLDGARANLAHDLPDWDFDAVVTRARAQWAAVLDKVAIEGGTPDQRQIFRTALYHTMLEPRRFADVDAGTPYERRTVFSGWDVFRAQMPLMTIIDEQVVTDQLNTLIDLTDSGQVIGLARWELLGTDTDTMLGDPAINLIAEAVLKGIVDFDVDKAYRFSREVALGPAERSNRGELANWLQQGYASGEYSLSMTVENAYTDHALARLAEHLGHPDDAAILDASAQNYRNVFNPELGWFRGRHPDGTWMGPDEGCAESNPEQQGWFVPHDVAGLIDLVGGPEPFIERLNAIFENTPPADLMKWNDFYNHSNEPVHQMAFLFTYAGAPWLTQKWSRYICDHGYGTGPEGLGGNEDCGQMSAWYIFAAAGLYPVSPVDQIYILGSPIFDTVTFRTSRGTEFAVRRTGTGPYVASATLNGRPIDRAWITHSEVVTGGELHFHLTPAPTDWGSKQLPPRLRRR